MQNCGWQDDSVYLVDAYRLVEIGDQQCFVKMMGWAIHFLVFWNSDFGMRFVEEGIHFSGYFKYSIFNLQSSII